ncbi:MAG: type II secretion system protein GspM, partial [Pseudomonadota bacterium]
RGNPMSGRLIDFLLRLAPRERWLLALLFALVVPLGLLFGVLLPLKDAKANALTDRTEAVAINLWVQERVGEYQSLNSAPRTGPQPAMGTSGIEQSLIEAGLRGDISDLSQDSAGQITLRFDDVRFTRLMTWLSETEPGWGYDVTQFRIEAVPEPANVAATLTLDPQEL